MTTLETWLGLCVSLLSIITGVLGTVAFIRTRQPRVAWRIVAVGPDHFALINDGRKTAHKVIVDREASGVMIMAGTLGFEPVDIPAGHSVRFVIAAVSRYTGGGWQIGLKWRGQDSPQAVLLPTNTPVAA